MVDYKFYKKRPFKNILKFFFVIVMSKALSLGAKFKGVRDQIQQSR